MSEPNSKGASKGAERNPSTTMPPPPEGQDPMPLLKQYERYGNWLRWLWLPAVLCFFASALTLFFTLPADYQPLTQHIAGIAVNPTDTSAIRLWVQGKGNNMVLESSNCGQHYVPLATDGSDSTARAKMSEWQPIPVATGTPSTEMAEEATAEPPADENVTAK